MSQMAAAAATLAGYQQAHRLMRGLSPEEALRLGESLPQEEDPFFGGAAAAIATALDEFRARQIRVRQMMALRALIGRFA